MGRVRTKTVKKSSRQVIERYYSQMTLDFHTNKKMLEEVAIIPTKRLRNKIAGFSTHLMRRIQRGPVRGISLKLQEEERERRMDFVPDESAIKVDQIVVDKETIDMLATLGMADLPGVEKQPDAPAGNVTYPSRPGGHMQYHGLCFDAKKLNLFPTCTAYTLHVVDRRLVYGSDVPVTYFEAGIFEFVRGGHTQLLQQLRREDGGGRKKSRRDCDDATHVSFVLRADESFQHRQRSMKNIEKLFFTCTRWQVEETIDLINCPYHYFCDSAYRGDYSPIVDLLVLLFAVSSFFTATAFTLREFSLRRSRTEPSIGSFKRRHLLPSGPIALTLVVLIFANGQRINTIFPLSRFGPALLQLVYFSALAFRNRAETDIKYGVLEASTVSGILHASLRLDSIILPYYTGLEALTDSYFSGVCTTCVCRRNALAAGGSSVAYRGWSKTTVLIATALCSRMACRIVGEQKLALSIRLTLEGVSWLLMAKDSFDLMLGVVPQGSLLTTVVYAGLCVLIFLNFLRMVFNLSVSGAEKHHKKEIIVMCRNDVEMAR
ncbi:unnamed protein product [Musa hybrid cultivar]